MLENVLPSILLSIFSSLLPLIVYKSDCAFIPHWTKSVTRFQWRRSVVKCGGQGQSGQAIKMFQITPYRAYVNDIQTLNTPGSWQPIGASKMSFTFCF